MASLLAPAPGRTGPRDEEVAAMERPKGAFVTTKARFSALHLPSKGGDQLKAQLARRREDEDAWLFEIEFGNLHATCPGRDVAFFMPLRRPGTVPNAGVRYGPGSAAHRFAKCYALRCVRGTVTH